MSPHYERFIRMVETGRYFHVGRRPLFKTYGYIGNVVRQYERLLAVPGERIHRRTLYVADETPLSLRAWADAIQAALGAPPIRTLPVALARLLAAGGDVLNRCGWKSYPFNSFRLKNILTEYQLDVSETVRICGPSAVAMEQGVAELVAWFRERPRSRPAAAPEARERLGVRDE